ncbi:MAG: hypothetical protein JNM39_07510 [Bdellovibrionaceae bacterium]|nr:hypothetical protein [Pseudobdellovibrionaceae bacterium]
MPIFEIRALPQKPGVNHQAAMKRLCCEIATIMKISERQVWATWAPILPGDYLEGGNSANIQPDSTHPPIVNLVAFEGRPESLIEKVINQAAVILCEELKIETGNVYIQFTETKSGRTYVGGELRRK